jgi:cytochrome b involved in lipid metabolism
MIDFGSEEELTTYAKSNGHKLIAFEGTVYDVGGYMSNHPGGMEYIEDRLGKIID